MNAEPSADFVAKEAIEFEPLLGLLGGGGVLIWLGIQALDPAWATEEGRGLKIVNLFKWALSWLGDIAPAVRGGVVIGVGAVLVVLGLALVLHYAFWREPRLIVDANGIESLSEEKSKGRLAWKDIASVREVGDIVQVNGSGDISVKTKEIDKSVKEVFAAIARHRPDVRPAGGRSAAAALRAAV